ncbi:PAS domain-containing protein [Luteithermobacter gelatinilyticus]|uniref:PAS domain-containing protein n=1 Tax=Luteithermobacter gelatinilyticus TaxID=2582913 RepID=UPI0011063806|nr:PAS domain-containing protein [Luteithermobacter gelatinilyticus]|tara:strand:+ start:6431 stop:6958 length:528 start_codon:yes stop_codon:yes gene_type:complete
MSRPITSPTGHERTFGENEIIVSKTDLKGKIIYVNELFEKISGYTQKELLGQPHNIIRHPDMPRSIFHLAWETLKQGNEIFAYVKNMCKQGDHYWVLAHMAPSYDLQGTPVGYHSNRRCPNRENVAIMEGIYAELRQIESRATTPKEAILKARAHLDNLLSQKKLAYDEFIFSLT